MADSIFTKIVKGELPCHKVYEDEKTMAFLDIHPKTPGHTLVITKEQIDEFQNLSDADFLALMMTVKKVSKRIKEVLKPDRIGLQVIGVDVPHAHIHVFPFNTMDEYRRQVDLTAASDHQKLAEMAQKLRF